MVSIRIQSNAGKIADNIARLPAKLRARAYRKALRAAGNIARVSITDAIESGTQVRTGTLRQARALRLSVQVQRRIKEGRISWRSDAWYGRFIARGTGQDGALPAGSGSISPRVFTDDASQTGLPKSVEQKIVDAYIDSFVKELEKAWLEAFSKTITV